MSDKAQLWNFLDEQYRTGKLKLPPPYMLEMIQNIKLDYPQTYGYQNEYPFRQVNQYTNILFAYVGDNFIYFYKPGKKQPTRQILHLEAKQGYQARLWRMWHGLFPTNETFGRGWKTRIETRTAPELIPEPEQVKVELIQIGYHIPQTASHVDFSYLGMPDENITYLRLGYYAERDILIWQDRR